MQNTFHSEPTEPVQHNPYYRNPYEQIPPPPPKRRGYLLHILLAISLLAVLGSIGFGVVYLPKYLVSSLATTNPIIPSPKIVTKIVRVIITPSIASATPTVSREFITGKTCEGSGQNCSLCAVGVIGHHAVTEFEHPPVDWLAGDCKSFESRNPDYFAEPTNNAYPWENMPKVCGTYGTEGTTVYDDGTQQYGIEMCNELGITPYCFNYSWKPTVCNRP